MNMGLVSNITICLSEWPTFCMEEHKFENCVSLTDFLNLVEICKGGLTANELNSN